MSCIETLGRGKNKNKKEGVWKVQPSPGGKLASIVEENLNKWRQPKGTKKKIVEGNGLRSSLGLIRSNQFPRVQCQRQDCHMCVQDNNNKGTLCDKCLRCVDTVCKYVGESSRTGFTRTREHMLQLTYPHPHSPMGLAQLTKTNQGSLWNHGFGNTLDMCMGGSLDINRAWWTTGLRFQMCSENAFSGR